MDNATKKFAETPSETLPEDLFALSPGGEPGSQSEKVTSKRMYNIILTDSDNIVTKVFLLKEMGLT